MKKREIILSFFIAAVISIFPGSIYSWEKFDSVIALVNNRPILKSELELKLNHLKETKRIPARKIPYEKSRILDEMIENELVFETAERESIYITDKRVIGQLENFMKNFFKSDASDEKELDAKVARVSKNLEQMIDQFGEPGFKIDPDLKKFIAYIEKNEKIDFLLFFEDLRAKVAREQIMSIAVGITPPSREEAMAWFKKNRAKLGYEINVKHILIIPKSASLKDEKEANSKMDSIRKRILAGESFEKLAASYSQDPGSASRGGDLGWQMIAQLDPYFANQVHNMKRKGQISTVFKSGFGYHIVKYMGRRNVSFDKVENMIMYKLYTEGLEAQFKKWVKQKKKESSITIFMDNYVQG